MYIILRTKKEDLENRPAELTGFIFRRHDLSLPTIGDELAVISDADGSETTARVTGVDPVQHGFYAQVGAA